MGVAPRVDAVVGPFAAAAGLDESELPETIACDNTFADDVVMMGTLPRDVGAEDLQQYLGALTAPIFTLLMTRDLALNCGISKSVFF